MTGPVGALTGEVKGLPDLESVRGPGAKLAFVQLLLANKCRESAVELMNKLDAEKGFPARGPEMLAKFNAKIEEAMAQGGFAELSHEDAQWCGYLGIRYPGDDQDPPPTQILLSRSAWETLANNTQAVIDNPPDNGQTLMVLIQDQLGQYNSFTQGSSANIGSTNTITQSLARW